MKRGIIGGILLALLLPILTVSTTYGSLIFSHENPSSELHLRPGNIVVSDLTTSLDDYIKITNAEGKLHSEFGNLCYVITVSLQFPKGSMSKWYDKNGYPSFKNYLKFNLDYSQSEALKSSTFSASLIGDTDGSKEMSFASKNKNNGKASYSIYGYDYIPDTNVDNNCVYYLNSEYASLSGSSNSLNPIPCTLTYRFLLNNSSLEGQIGTVLFGIEADD